MNLDNIRNFGNRNYKSIIAITTISVSLFTGYCFSNNLPEYKNERKMVNNNENNYTFIRSNICNKNILERIIFIDKL